MQIFYKPSDPMDEFDESEIFDEADVNIPFETDTDSFEPLVASDDDFDYVDQILNDDLTTTVPTVATVTGDANGSLTETSDVIHSAAGNSNEGKDSNINSVTNQNNDSNVNKDGSSINTDDDSDDYMCDSSDSENSNDTDDLFDDDEEVIKEIIAATKTPRSNPPDIITNDFVVDISFHPISNILAVATMSGDVHLYKYSNEENLLLKSHEVHCKAIRNIEFDDSGETIFSVSKDKAIVLTDTETGNFKKYINDAHAVAINRIYNIKENLIATGDDDGICKLWDTRTNMTPMVIKKYVDDYISSMISNDDGKILVTSSGDGFVTSIDIGTRKLYVQSEPHEAELTCLGLFRNQTKLIVGSTKGCLYTYDWGSFGLFTDMYPGVKSSLNLMIPITERIAVLGGEEGKLRGMHVVPGRNLGIVGQHSLGIEALDISNNGELIASSSHDNDIKFWNIKYFEDYDTVKYNQKQDKLKDSTNELPSSKYISAVNFFAGL